ncbi:MAG: Gfo/Idh/MocA family oxidoreductase [Candidatus Hydrogenedens sp.]|nr:Gfo/Idh/MocA family oxidoreductase [Candidatus Hydrogenedens sp.]
MNKLLSLFVLIALVFSVSARAEEAPLKLGMIGLDTSHVIAFTQVLNNPDNAKHVPGGRVVAAYKGGSPDLESSISRVDGYTEQLVNDFGVKIVSTIEELCTLVDAVLLMSVDGRPHLEQAIPVIKAGKRLFIDKPLGGSLADARAIAAFAKEHDVPWFTSSSYRFYESMQALKNKDVGEVRGAVSYGPASLDPTHPDLFWYGIHATEALFTIMGTGCEKVTCFASDDFHVATGCWEGGRMGTLYGLRTGAAPHRVTVFGTKAVADQQGGGDYAPLVAEIIKFFQTGVVPVPPEETLEMFAFMEAAHESLRRGGTPVSLSEVIEACE